MDIDSDDNILKHIRDVLGNQPSNFNILEHQVDVTIQMEYFEYSRNHKVEMSYEDLIAYEPNLYFPETSYSKIRSSLVGLASIDRPEAYRIIERYYSKAPPELKDWAAMALQESRMLLESRLLDEHQVFISTGLGGKDGKLRYFVVLFSTSEDEFTSTQRNVIKSEFELSLKNCQGKVEKFEFCSSYATMMALVPLNIAVKEPFLMAINECNSLGEFIKSSFLVTNVKPLTREEIDEIIVGRPSKKNT